MSRHHPSSRSSSALRQWSVRILRSPVLAWRQLSVGLGEALQSAGYGSPGGASLLPMYAYDDSQAKLGKGRTLVRDLLLFACLAFLLLVGIATAAPALFHGHHAAAHANTPTTANTAAGVKTDTTIPPSSVSLPDTVVVDTVDTNPPAEQNDSAAGASTPTPDVGSPSLDALNEKRRDAVRDAFKHAWGGYSRYSFGHDEVRPVSNETNDSWGGWGATLVDGLDTAMLMGLDEEVARAREHVAGMNFDRDFVASFFETTIRYLGGLLGAFELSRDPLYLTKAKELADLLVRGFDASPTGLPMSRINMKQHTSSNQRWASGFSILAEVGSVQLEMEYLSYHTGDPSYREKARKVFDVLEQADKSIPGLYPTYIDPSTGHFTNGHISFGSFGDSFYEYLLKLYLLTDRRDQGALRMWNDAMRAMEDHMIKQRRVEYVDPSTKQAVTKTFAFLGELSGKSYVHKMEHLTCFLPGLLALGVSLVADEDFRKREGWSEGKATHAERNAIMRHDHAHTTRGVGESDESHGGAGHLQLTEQEMILRASAERHARTSTALLETCVAAYQETSTGLAPETIDFSIANAQLARTDGGPQPEVDPAGVLRLGTAPLLGSIFRIDQTKYILRPETLESIFVQYRLTGDERYRDLGWTIFENLVKSCRTRTAFSGVVDVNRGHGRGHKEDRDDGYDPIETQQRRQVGDDSDNWTNSQESFFFAETLKYLYLLFSPPDFISLDHYVFNTEAHPLGILVEHE